MTKYLTGLHGENQALLLQPDCGQIFKNGRLCSWLNDLVTLHWGPFMHQNKPLWTLCTTQKQRMDEKNIFFSNSVAECARLGAFEANWRNLFVFNNFMRELFCDLVANLAKKHCSCVEWCLRNDGCFLATNEVWVGRLLLFLYADVQSFAWCMMRMQLLWTHGLLKQLVPLAFWKLPSRRE